MKASLPIQRSLYRSHFVASAAPTQLSVHERALASNPQGDGSAPSSLSRADIRRSRLSGAAGFPTPFSTASGVIGLVAGPSNVLRR
jgi:hypothetical protein